MRYLAVMTFLVLPTVIASLLFINVAINDSADAQPPPDNLCRVEGYGERFCPVPTVTRITCIGSSVSNCKPNSPVSLSELTIGLVKGTVYSVTGTPVDNLTVMLYASNSLKAEGTLEKVGEAQVNTGHFVTTIDHPTLQSASGTSYLIATTVANESFATSSSNARFGSTLEISGPTKVVVGEQVDYAVRLLYQGVPDDSEETPIRVWVTDRNGENVMFARDNLTLQSTTDRDLRGPFQLIFDAPGTYQVNSEFNGGNIHASNTNTISVTAQYRASIELDNPPTGINAQMNRVTGSIVIAGSTFPDFPGPDPGLPGGSIVPVVPDLSPEALSDIYQNLPSVTLQARQGEVLLKGTELRVAADGSFEWSLEPDSPGEVVILATLPESSLVTEANGTTATLFKTLSNLTLEAPTQARKGHKTTILGQVTDSSNRSVEHARVVVTFAPGTTEEGNIQTNTDDMGRFNAEFTPTAVGSIDFTANTFGDTIFSSRTMGSVPSVSVNILEVYGFPAEVTPSATFTTGGRLSLSGASLANELVVLQIDNRLVAEAVSEQDGTFTFDLVVSDLALEEGLFAASYEVPAFDERLEVGGIRIFSDLTAWVVSAIIAGVVVIAGSGVALGWAVGKRRSREYVTNGPIFGDGEPGSELQVPASFKSAVSRVNKLVFSRSNALEMSVSAVAISKDAVPGVERQPDEPFQFEVLATENEEPIAFGKVTVEVRNLSKILGTRRMEETVEVEVKEPRTTVTLAISKPGNYNVRFTVATPTGKGRATLKVAVVSYRQQINDIYNRLRMRFTSPAGPVPPHATPRELEAFVADNALVADPKSLSNLVHAYELSRFSQKEITRQHYAEAIIAKGVLEDGEGQ